MKAHENDYNLFWIVLGLHCEAIKAKSPLQRAFPGFPYDLQVVVGDMCAMNSAH